MRRAAPRTAAPALDDAVRGGSHRSGADESLQQRGAPGGPGVEQPAGEPALQLDELQVHVAPVFLGGGVRLFDRIAADVGLEIDRVVDSPKVTHLRYRVIRS